MRYKLLAIMFFFIALTSVADRLDGIVETILDNNIELKAMKARQNSEIAGLRADNVLPGPEAQFSFVASPEEKKWDISVSQGFEWPGAYSARSKASSLRADAFEMLYRQERRSLEIKVRETILNYLMRNARKATLEIVNDNLGRLTQAYEKALDHGEATILDVKKLEILAFNIARMISDTENEIKGYEAAIWSLNGGESLQIPMTEIPIPSLRPKEAYLSEVISSDPAVKVAAALRNAARADMKAVDRASLPGFAIGYIHEYEEKTHFNGFSFGINLPSWKNSYKKKRIQDELMAIDFEESAAVSARKAQIEADYTTASRAFALMEKGKFLLTDQYASLLDKSLKAGQIDLITYLSDLNEFIDARSSFLDLQLEYAIAASNLELIVKD